uniref:Myosin IXB n=1 Tax=Takifugu rubripes TaxID=31033 RepID=A0A674PFG0_TAKRU
MSTTDGVGVPKLDRNPRVVQIHPRVSQNTAAYCPLQISSGDTARTVIRNALVTLGLDDSRTYSLLEVRDSHQEERPLEPSDCLLERVRLWPPETQRWHPETQGYYFVLQQTDSGAPEDGDRIDDYDDLCSLQAVSEASILEALCQRFYRLKIYTYAGNILIAINPNKFLPVYYNPKYIKMYEKQPLGKLSPHIFAVADAAFRAMLDNQVNQCIVMHGNSGSGKTESSSYLIHCLTALSEKTCSVGLKRTILGAVPVLQAFGNARTSENNNSSRFGKFIQLNYLESGVIRGAVIEKWLLEKSRLVSRDKNERNYHVFYYLLMGASRDEQEEFHLLKPQDYFYLNQGDLHLDDDSNFGQEYKRLKQAMEMVGFLASTKKHIFSVLSAILLLGNVTYTLAEDTKVLEVGPAEVLSTLSDLLKVKVDLLTKALTKRKLVVANTTVESQYTLHEASRVRDTMAKSLYSALFEWIILHINHAMLNRRDMEESVSGLSIGILDMFGFENLQKNTFEQLCINYSNEKLQYYINQHIFKFKQEDYVSEGITWQNIDFVDNSGCIQLIGEKPSGLFDLLDQELPWATAKTLLDKLKQLHQDDPFLVTSSNADGTFVIQHFAGRVKYHIQDFRRENNEHMPPEVVSLLRSSEQSFFHHLVASSPEALFRWGVLRATIRIIAVFKSMGRHRAELSSGLERLSSNSLTLDFSFDRSDDLPLDVFEDIFTNYENRKKSRSGRQKQLIPKNLMDYVSLQHVVGLTAHDQTSKLIYHPHRTAKVPTYSTQVQASLNKLMARIEKAEPFFIFCIRSNDQKKELHFDSELVLQQIKNMGITQMVHIQKSGYSAKYTFKEFVEKFRLLLPKGATEAPEHIKELFERMEINKSSYQIGKTKVFLKEKERQLLRDTLTKEVMRRIIILQRWFRTCLIRLHFLQRRDATTIIQRSWREYYEKKNRAATVIQSAWASCLKRSPGQPPSQPRLGRDSLICWLSRDSLTKKGLRRQQHVEVSPNRIQNPDPTCSRSAQRDRSKEKCEGRGSPPPLNRPLSLPLDPKVCIGNQSSRPIMTYKEKQSDDSSPDMQRWVSQSLAHHLSWPNQVRVRFRKQPKRKRRLAYPRSGLIVNFGSSKESEYWSFPLPPISPHVSAMKSSASSVDVRARKSQVKVLTYILKKLWLSSACSPHHNSERVKRNPTIQISRATRVMESNASLDREITDPQELQNLDEFLGNQVYELRTRIKELSPTESVFLTATMQFRQTIKEMYSLKKPKVGYKDLMKGYHNKVNTLAGSKSKTEVSLVINLFQSVLDGFIRGELKRLESEPAKVNFQRRKRTNLASPLDHRFSTYQVSIMQSCDLCGSYIWGMEKAYMCSACKLICHKKCLNKIITDCSTRRARQVGNSSLHFGVQVYMLTSKANPVPKVIEMLLMHVEINGLYTEGLYRKSGSACRAKELHQILETTPESACLDNYVIHTVTGLVKRWLRELPDPLMTFDLYTDFLHAAELPDKAEKIRAVYQKVDELPPANYNTLERLIFHLVRVAKEEEHNKMSPSSLAIVFAPCILRSPDVDNPFLSMKDVPRTTACVEILITEQFRRYKEKMQNIQELEYAEALAVHQLKLRRQNTLEQENSDNEILDSASSMSSESLEDRLGSVDSEEKNQRLTDTKGFIPA